MALPVPVRPPPIRDQARGRFRGEGGGMAEEVHTAGTADHGDHGSSERPSPNLTPGIRTHRAAERRTPNAEVRTLLDTRHPAPGTRYPLALPLLPFPGIDPDGDGAVVNQADFHVRAELPRRHRPAMPGGQ